MLRTSRGRRSNSVNNRRTKNKLLSALNGCFPPVMQCEPLEQRTLLSVSGATLAGPLFTPGTSWTYQLTTLDGDTATFTRTVIGPTTFNGQPVTEVDSFIGKASGKSYIGLNAAGDLVEYGQDSFSTLGNDHEIYTPYTLFLPVSMTAGAIYTSSSTDTDVYTSPDGNGSDTSTTAVDTSVSLFSETTESITVPLGTYDAYKLHSTETDTVTFPDDTQMIDTFTLDQWSVDGIGVVRILDDNGNLYALTDFNGQAEHLTFTQSPTDTEKGETLAPIKVSVQNKDGVDTDATGSITLSLNTITGDGKLSGTVTRPLVDGVATFDDLKIDGGGTYTFTAVDSASPPVVESTSSQFTITVPALTWTGKGDGLNWSDPKNWDANIKPRNGDALIFPTGSPLTSNNDLSGLSIASIDIQGAGYTIKGNSIKLTTGLTSEAGNNTYNIDTQLVGSPTIEDQTGDLTIKSVLSGGSLTIGGSGTVNFTQANTYTGPTTLKAGVTIGDSVLSGAFGTAGIKIGSGAKAVTIANTSGGSATISNDVTFEDGATLAVDPTVIFEGSVKLTGQNAIEPIGVDDEVDFGDIIGAGTLTLIGDGIFKFTGDLAAGAKIIVESGELDLEGNLLGTADDQITISGGKAIIFGTLQGTGGIDVQGGTLLTDEPGADGGTSTFTGNVTLEDGGTIKILDTADGNGLGKGTLILQGGLLQNAATVVVGIDNDTVFDTGTVILSGGTGILFRSKNLKTVDLHAMQVTGNVAFAEAVTLNGQLTIDTFDGSFLDFFGGIKGNGNIFGDGSGTTVLEGTLPSTVKVVYSGKNAGLTGGLVIAATLAGTGTQIFVTKGGAAELSGSNSKYGAVKGTGGIDVTGATLVTDERSGAGGALSYSGNISVGAGGFVKIYDVVDAAGLGTGSLDLFGGTIINSVDKPIEIGNSLEVNSGATIIVHGESGITFSGASNLMDDKSVLAITGNIDIESKVSLSGSAEIITTIADDTVLLKGGLDGTGTFFSDGPGAIGIAKSVASDILITALGTSVGTTGTLVLAGALNGADNQVTIKSGGVVELRGLNSKTGVVSGTGGIDVEAGATLLSDETDGHGGIANYKGNITLEAGGTIKLYDILDDTALGIGTLDLKGGLVQNSASDEVTISNAITLEGAQTNLSGSDKGLAFSSDTIQFADQAIVVSKGLVYLKGNVELSGDVAVETAVAGDALFFFGGIQGAGKAYFDGPGIIAILKTVGEDVHLISHGDSSNTTGGLAIAAKLLGTGDDQIKIEDGGRVALSAGDGSVLVPVSGTGGIMVVNGTLASDEASGKAGLANYSGNITVEEKGTLKYYDSKDGAGFGTGLIYMKGGLLQNSSGGFAFFNNDLTLEGQITISGGTEFAINSNTVTLNGPGILTTGIVRFVHAVTFSGGGANVETSADADTLAFEGGIKGDGTLGVDGPGQTIVAGTIESGVDLVAHGAKNGSQGELLLAGKLDSSVDQVTVESGGRVHIAGAGNPMGTLSGLGGIVVNGGFLLAGSTVEGGSPGYAGTITLDDGGTIKVADTKDGNGLGTEKLILRNGTVQNDSGTIVTLNNDIDIEGVVQFSSHDNRLKLAGGVTIDPTGELDVFGFVALTGALVGTGSLNVANGELAVAGSNPVYVGHIFVNSGATILVTADYALGQGSLTTNSNPDDPDYIIAVAAIGDPILNNPLVIESGTLVLNGEFTFPNGVTIKPGAKLEIQGPASAVIVSGPLAGAGGVIIDAGTFSATGDQSGFTGNISNQSGKFIPALTVTDAGGSENGSPFPANYTLTGDGTAPGTTLDGVSATLTYYVGNKVAGQGSANAPSTAGTYTVIASFPGSANYAAIQSEPVTFVISPKQTTKTTPTISVADAGGVFNGSPFPATVTLTGTSGTPTATLDGVSPTLTYYAGLVATGTPLGGAPINPGDYTVVASFAGSSHYTSASDSKTFTIQKAVVTPPPSDAVQISTLNPTFVKNGWGNFERNKSNGETGSNDGRKITLNGQQFDSGLGVHADSELRYALNGGYTRFTAWVGLDDEVGNKGSVIFQVWVDGVKVFDSGLMTGATNQKFVDVDLTSKNELKLIVLSNGNKDFDHADWADAKLFKNTVVPPPAASDKFLSDLNPTVSTNGWGKFERDRSNGETGDHDGKTITLNNVAYAKGLGVHSDSELRYSLGGQFKKFTADIGIDDEVGTRGNVIFQVWLDGVKLYDSGAMTGASITKHLNIDVTGKNELKLIVLNNGGKDFDHADWANAMLLV